MNWALIVRNHAAKDLKKLPLNEQERIKRAIDEMVLDPFFGNIEKLRDQNNVWRKRIGNYRIFFELHKNSRAINILRIKRRTSKTY